MSLRSDFQDGMEPFEPKTSSEQFNAIAQKLKIDQHPLIVTPETLLQDVIEQMSQTTVSCALGPKADAPAKTDLPPKQRRSYALIIREQKLLGIFTERDLVKLTAEGISLTHLSVETVMSRNVVTLLASDIKDAFTSLSVMRQHRIRHLPVCDHQGSVCGVITTAKLREALPASALLKRRQVQEIMATSVITAPPHTRVIEIAQLMAAHRVSCIIIQTADRLPPQGIITEYDIVKIQRLSLNLSNLTADTFMSAPLVCLNPADRLSEAQKKMQALNVRRLVVVNDAGLLAGLVTQTSILSVLDPHEMAATIEELEQQVKQLQNERIQLLQAQNLALETRVKTGETSLLISQEKFRATFEQAAVGIAHLNLNGNFVSVNHRFGEILGYQPTELHQRSFAEFTHPEDKANILDKVRELLQGTVPFFSQEKRYLRRDNSILWGNVTVSLAIPPSGEPSYLIAVLEDICDRKQAETALQQLNQELGVRVALRTAELQASERRYRMLFESAPDLLFVINMRGEIQQINSAVTQRLGYTENELKGHLISDLLANDPETNYQQTFENLALQSIHRQEMELLSRTSQTLFVECASNVIAGTEGRNPYILVIQRDITARKQLEARLRSAEKQMRTVFEAMHDVVLVCQTQAGEVTSINIAPTTPQGLEHTPELLAEKTIRFLWDNASQAVRQTIQQVMATGKAMEYEYSFLVDEQTVFFLANISPMSDNAALWVARNISALKHTERALFREKELAQVTLESIGDAVITTDIHGNIYQFNTVAEQLTGWSIAEAKGQPLSEVFNIVHEETRQPAENPVQKALRERKIVGLANHTVLINRHGTEYGIEDSAAPIRDRDGHVIGAVMVFHDVTESRTLTRQLSWQASHDPLTQLINRRKFERVMVTALQTARQEHKYHALCFLDLDRFKVINDTCGHNAGDELLCQVSTLLQQGIRTNDTLARLGGDEFAVLLYDCPVERAIDIAEGLRKAVEKFRFHWMNETFSIGVSIGLAKINQESSDLASILSAADTACYAAKTKGRNRLQIYGENDTELIQQRGEQWWSIRIKQAIEDNRLCLYSQSIVPTIEPAESTEKTQKKAETSAKKTARYEILLRMVDEQGRIIIASEFIPAAERYNLMPEIDRWVVQRFLNDYCLHHAATDNFQPAKYLINLSGTSVGDEQFLNFLKAQLGQNPSIAPHICFEITETAAISNLSQAVCFMEELKQLGCQFALDDFGSGMASFAYLKTLPINYLKIDGRFIEEIIHDPSTFAIVESINHIGHVMGMQTIAEFVSSSAIREKLQTIGVDYVQGFDISKPCQLAFA